MGQHSPKMGQHSPKIGRRPSACHVRKFRWHPPLSFPPPTPTGVAGVRSSTIYIHTHIDMSENGMPQIVYHHFPHGIGSLRYSDPQITSHCYISPFSNLLVKSPCLLFIPFFLSTNPQTVSFAPQSVVFNSLYIPVYPFYIQNVVQDTWYLPWYSVYISTIHIHIHIHIYIYIIYVYNHTYYIYIYYILILYNILYYIILYHIKSYYIIYHIISYCIKLNHIILCLKSYCTYIYICTFINTHTHTHIYIYIYICIYKWYPHWLLKSPIAHLVPPSIPGRDLRMQLLAQVQDAVPKPWRSRAGHLGIKI